MALFEAELGRPSGIGPMRDDECPVDPVAFRAFAQALVTRHLATRHGVLTAPSEGFVAAVLVLAERAALELAAPAPAEEASAAELRAKVRAPDRAMTR
ncbi:DUF6086 family protein [Streptomyces sp. NPDC087917]|uniref:DUF6086 family protein n=1 Tax=unclassified Streptomyces TaxID=2593676 RepID=UPI00343F1639